MAGTWFCGSHSCLSFSGSGFSSPARWRYAGQKGAMIDQVANGEVEHD